MIARQQQVLDSFVRVQAFLDAHPVMGVPGYDHARATLDEVLERLRAHAGAQVSGRGRSEGTTVFAVSILCSTRSHPANNA